MTITAARTPSSGEDQTSPDDPDVVGAGAGLEPVASPAPAVDLTRIIVTTELVAGAVLIARMFTRRPSTPRMHVTMGPGGWVSVKGGAIGVRRASRPWARPRPVAPTHAPEHAPLWARVLSAVPLEPLNR